MKCPKWEAQGPPQLLVLAWSRNGKAVKCQGSPCSLCAEARAAHSPGGVTGCPPGCAGPGRGLGGRGSGGRAGGAGCMVGAEQLVPAELGQCRHGGL